MMLIVLSVDVLNVEAKIQPQDVDQVYIGQTAILRFSSFSQRTTPELNGVVKQISADVSEDQKIGARFYTLRISVPETELKRLGNLKLIPGMPVDAFVPDASHRSDVSDQIARRPGRVGISGEIGTESRRSSHLGLVRLRIKPSVARAVGSRRKSA